MNKKTLYFLGVVGAVVVVAISIQRGKSPHAEPLSPSAASKPAVRPSVPVSQPPSNIVVRAVETRQADDEMAVEKPSVSAARKRTGPAVRPTGSALAGGRRVIMRNFSNSWRSAALRTCTTR